MVSHLIPEQEKRRIAKRSLLHLLFRNGEESRRRWDKLREIGASDKRLRHEIKRETGNRLDVYEPRHGQKYLFRYSQTPTLFVGYFNHWGKDDITHLKEMKPTLHGKEFFDMVRELLEIPYPLPPKQLDFFRDRYLDSNLDPFQENPFAE